jgi:branched-subunit amino acid ABC-type transport system permease component
MLAIYGRPSTWNWLLAFHVVSALLVFVGAIVVASASLYALRTTTPERAFLLRRLALVTSLLTIPPYIGIHIFGGLLADREFPKGVDEPAWVGFGFGVTDLYGIVSIIILTLLQWWVVRRTRRGDAVGWQEKLASWLAPVGPVLLLAVLFAMSAKPGQS